MACLLARGDAPSHLHLEMIAWDRCWVFFDDELVVGWVKLKLAGLEQDCHRDDELHLGDARSQAGVIAQSKGSINARASVFVAWFAEAVDVKVQRVGKTLLQKMRDRHCYKDIGSRIETIAADGERFGDAARVPTRDGIAPKRLPHDPGEI